MTIGLVAILVCAPCFIHSSKAQGLESQMQQLFCIADEHNTSIQSYRTALEKAQLDIDAAKQQRLPDVNTSLSVSYIGTAQLFNRDMSYYGNPDLPHWGNYFTLEAQQVLYSGGALTSGIRLAELGKEMNVLDETSGKQGVHMLLAGLLLQYKQLQNRLNVVEQNITLTDDLLKKTRDRHQQGLILKNDITRYELLREQMTLAKTTIKDGMSVIEKQMQTAVGTSSLPGLSQDSNDYEEFAAKYSAISEQTWQDKTLVGSSSLQKAMTAIEMEKQKEKLVRSASLPKVAVVASENLNGPNIINVPALDKNVNYWYVGVGITYDISSLYKNKKKVQSAATSTKYAHEQREVAKDGISDAVHAAYVGLQTAQAELATRKKSVELSQQNYETVSNRYNEGLAIVTDMTDAANVRLDAELQLVDARIAVAMAIYRLKYLCGEI